MQSTTSEIADQIRVLSDNEKVELVNRILEQLDKPDPEIDRIWAKEAKKRWQAYKEGRMATVGYEEVMKKYSRG